MKEAMKLWLVVSILGAGSALLAEAPERAAEPVPPKIMILASFHFGGSSTDRISVTMGDVTTPERQAEIEEVVERLATFEPTKIMVEMPADRQEDLDEVYRVYLAGEHELTQSEGQQIGMRLAKRLGHESVYAVDHKQGMDFQRMMEAGQAAGQGELLAWFQTTMADIQRKMEKVHSPENSILHALRFHNSDWAHQANGLYLQLALLGTSEDPAGAEVVGGWYERNLKIYANIARALEPGDRALVVFGSGHLAHLADFFEQNPHYEWVSALEALGEPE